MAEEKEKRFLSAADVCEIMECSTSRAYGKINAKYFYERIYDGKGAAHECTQ